ncbi:MAG: sigma-70 family RNA polymerase sigma factor [Filimonas sp.]|nr:sigma-70 family RNA polymerase sigma factor [Filimonas sp.]
MEKTKLTDEELFNCIKRNDEDAYRILFNRYWEKLYLFAWRRLKSRQEAEDVVQHIFMKIWEQRAVRNITSMQYYLFKSVSYEIIAALKKMLDNTTDITTVNESILPIFNNILEKMSVDELDRLLEDEINKLPGRMQEIFRLSRQQGLAIQEIAILLELSEQTVKNQLSNAIARLRRPISEALFISLFCELTIR